MKTIVTTKLKVADNDNMALRYAGCLGHSVVVVVDFKPPHPVRSTGLETWDLASARKYAAEQKTNNPVIYKRTKNGWKAVK
jgi:hypothetical protein